jgi:hypothetical protein
MFYLTVKSWGVRYNLSFTTKPDICGCGGGRLNIISVCLSLCFSVSPTLFLCLFLSDYLFSHTHSLSLSLSLSVFLSCSYCYSFSLYYLPFLSLSLSLTLTLFLSQITLLTSSLSLGFPYSFLCGHFIQPIPSNSSQGCKKVVKKHTSLVYKTCHLFFIAF